MSKPVSAGAGELPSMLGSSEKPLSSGYDVALLDLDGVVYRGADPVPGAAAALAAVRENGMRVAFVTNNASRRPQQIADHLEELGVPAQPEDIVTSAQAAVRLLCERLAAGASVLVTGAPGLREEVAAAGFRVVDAAGQGAQAVVQGYDAQMTYPRLAEAALEVAARTWWVATNADSSMPSSRGRLPGNGALVAVIATTTDRKPEVAGKPQIALHRECIERTEAKAPLVVGDRLDTDIEGAVTGGSDSLLVLTGVTDPAALLRAGPHERPTYLGADLAALHTPHPPTELGRDGARCGGWRAWAEGEQLRLAGSGDPLDALRALCVPAWAGVDSDRPHRAVAPDGQAATEVLARLHLDEAD